MVALARHHKDYAQAWDDLDTLPARLSAGEPIRLLAVGMLGMSPALLALTDCRVVFTATTRLRASWTSGLLHGGLMFRTPSREVKVLALSDATATAFVEAMMSEPAAPPPQSPTADPVEQLRRLGSLRDTGVLTEEEFNAKKDELLRRI